MNDIDRQLAETQFSLDSLELNNDENDRESMESSKSEYQSSYSKRSSSTSTCTGDTASIGLKTLDEFMPEVLSIGLSPWEKWLVRKSLAEREQKLCMQKQKKVDFDVKEQKRRARNELREKAEVHYLLWKDAKERELRQKRANQRKAVSIDDEKKMREREKIASKSEESFDRWIMEKEQERRMLARKELEARRRDEEQLYQRKLDNERAFNDWLVEKRLQDLNPLDAYYNPDPWQFPMPKEKRSKDKKREKRTKKIYLPPSPPHLFKGRKTSKVPGSSWG
ncbi:coiled-coil domain-containing protein 34-like isoform X2 [Oscarella lobularis]|uniref:coiled-coil domain-containing protein 34-like isoform X2 n=1 Tax=Oscarella lobularis TaxID=121494 RepID=UPI003313EECD